MAQIQDETGNPILANVEASGAFAALNDEALVTLFGQAVATVQVAGLAGAITISFEGSIDGTTYEPVGAKRKSDGLVATSTTANGLWVAASGGLKKFRARVSAAAGGTADVAVVAGQGSGEAAFGGSVTVSGTVTVAEPVSVDDNGGSLTVDPFGGSMTVADGGGSLTVDGTVAISGTVPISAVALPLPAGAATSALQTQPGVDIGDVTVNNAAGTNPVPVQGNVAHDGVAAGNPVALGAQARTTFLAAVASGDIVSLIADKLGRLLVSLGVPRELLTQNNITLTTTTETTLIAAGGAGVFRDITAIIVSNTSGTAVRVDFRDATAGTVRFSLMIAANGGGGIFTPPRPVKQTTAANNWTAQLSAAVTDVRIFGQTEDNA